MQTLQVRLNNNYKVVEHAANCLNEKLYDIAFRVGEELLPVQDRNGNADLTCEQFDLISKVILQKCLAQYTK